MTQRALVFLICGIAAGWSLPSSAQQPAVPVIGILNSGPAGLRPEQATAFHGGLKQTGFVNGQNVTIEYRGADNRYERLPELAAELVGRPVAVIVASGGPVSALAAKKVTSTIPIVFTTIADPVKSGVVASLNRPGGNVTGNAGLTSELDPKRLELLHQIKPTAGPIGVLVNPNRPNVAVQIRDVQAAGDAIGRQVVILQAGTEREIDIAFETLVQQRVEALLVSADPFFNSRRAQVVELAARHAIPAIYQWRESAMAGGLMSYGPNITNAYHQTGVYVGRILKGEDPGKLPVMQPTKFELVINLKTAKTLGLAVPDEVLSTADETIE
jgi:ABC-type uncharacterized transport system substrate-binding protein